MRRQPGGEPARQVPRPGQVDGDHHDLDREEPGDAAARGQHGDRERHGGDARDDADHRRVAATAARRSAAPAGPTAGPRARSPRRPGSTRAAARCPSSPAPISAAPAITAATLSTRQVHEYSPSAMPPLLRAQQLAHEAAHRRRESGRRHHHRRDPDERDQALAAHAVGTQEARRHHREHHQLELRQGPPEDAPQAAADHARAARVAELELRIGRPVRPCSAAGSGPSALDGWGGCAGSIVFGVRRPSGDRLSGRSRRKHPIAARPLMRIDPPQPRVGRPLVYRVEPRVTAPELSVVICSLGRPSRRRGDPSPCCASHRRRRRDGRGRARVAGPRAAAGGCRATASACWRRCPPASRTPATSGSPGPRQVAARASSTTTRSPPSRGPRGCWPGSRTAPAPSSARSSRWTTEGRPHCVLAGRRAALDRPRERPWDGRHRRQHGRHAGADVAHRRLRPAAGRGQLRAVRPRTRS